jgi:hypothetical protein
MKTERYVWVFVVGAILALLTYQSCDNKRLKAKVKETTMQADSWRVMAQTLKCDTVFDTAYLPGKSIRPKRITDTIYLTADNPCPTGTYIDTIPFDGVQIAYRAVIRGYFDELELSPKITAPKIIQVPVLSPCPPPTIIPTQGKWSVNIMAGFPVCGYMGAQYQVSDNFGLTGGAFVSKKEANLLLGVNIRVQ